MDRLGQEHQELDTAHQLVVKDSECSNSQFSIGYSRKLLVALRGSKEVREILLV